MKSAGILGYFVTRNVILFVEAVQHCEGNEIKGVILDRTCSSDGKIQNVYRIRFRNSFGRQTLLTLGNRGRTILKYIFRKESIFPFGFVS
jgi:hypothetical protein